MKLVLSLQNQGLCTCHCEIVRRITYCVYYVLVTISLQCIITTCWFVSWIQIHEAPYSFSLSLPRGECWCSRSLVVSLSVYLILYNITPSLSINDEITLRVFLYLDLSCDIVHSLLYFRPRPLPLQKRRVFLLKRYF